MVDGDFICCFFDISKNSAFGFKPQHFVLMIRIISLISGWGKCVKATYPIFCWLFEQCKRRESQAVIGFELPENRWLFVGLFVRLLRFDDQIEDEILSFAHRDDERLVRFYFCCLFQA